MGDEIGEVRALRQVAGEGRGGVEDDQDRARRRAAARLRPRPPIAVSGTASTTASAPGQRLRRAARSRPRSPPSAAPGRPRSPRRGDVVARGLEVVRQAEAHFPPAPNSAIFMGSFLPVRWPRGCRQTVTLSTGMMSISVTITDVISSGEETMADAPIRVTLPHRDRGRSGGARGQDRLRPVDRHLHRASRRDRGGAARAARRGSRAVQPLEPVDAPALPDPGGSGPYQPRRGRHRLSRSRRSAPTSPR